MPLAPSSAGAALAALLALVVPPPTTPSAPLAEAPAGPPAVTRTTWDLRSAPAYDALCLLGALGGDPFYAEELSAELAHFVPLLRPHELQAFREVKRILKDEAGGIVSAQLTLQLSAVDPEGRAPEPVRGTIDRLLGATRDLAGMEAALRRTDYWSEASWAAYRRARPEVIRALEALRRTGFEAHWEATARPLVEKRIAEILPLLPRWDVVPAVERRLGHALPSRRITVLVLAYVRPHGIRVVGTRFLTDVSWPFEVVLRVAIHELLHPPFDVSRPEIGAAVRRLAADPLVRWLVEHHDPSFGYNSPEGYLDEDSVQALEAVISEELGLPRDQRAYWRAQDGGMHLVAAALYAALRRAETAAGGPLEFPRFLGEAVARGDLEGERLVREVTGFLGADALPARPAPPGAR